MISSIITKIDFISEKPQLLINNSDRAKNLYGGIMSIISVILLSIAGTKFCVELLKRDKSSLTYNQIPVTNSTINYSQFPFMVGLLDNGLKLIEEEERYYSFFSDVWNFYPDNSTGVTKMSLNRVVVKTERCDINKHFGEYKEYYKDVPYLSHHHCMVPGQNISLYGLYGSIQPYNFLDFWISTCVNNTAMNRTNCYSREKSKARLINTYISYQYLEYYLDHSNTYNPGKLILRSEILPVSSSIYKRNFIYIRLIEYLTDLDFLFSSYTEQNYHRMSDFRETADLRSEGTVPGSFALISVMLDSFFDQYNRRFTKVQELLANIGGLFKGVTLIASLLSLIFLKELYNYNLISYIYNDKRLSNILKLKNPINDMSEQKTNNYINNSQIINMDFEKIEKLKSTNIEMTKWELILYIFNSKRKKYREYKYAKQSILNNLCVKNIIKKLIDVSKLKCFLLTKDQLSVYNYIKNPQIKNYSDNKEDIWEKFLNNNILDSEQNPSNIVRTIQNIQNKMNRNDTEKNILNILNLI